MFINFIADVSFQHFLWKKKKTKYIIFVDEKTTLLFKEINLLVYNTNIYFFFVKIFVAIKEL